MWLRASEAHAAQLGLVAEDLHSQSQSVRHTLRCGELTAVDSYFAYCEDDTTEWTVPTSAEQLEIGERQLLKQSESVSNQMFSVVRERRE